MSSSEVKRLALKNLKGKWAYAIISLFLYMIIVYFLSMVVFGALLFSACILIGISSVFISISKGESENYGRLLDGFKDSSSFGQRILLSILKTVFILLWSLLFIIPGIIKTYSYSIAELVAYRYPDYTWKECLEESEKRMKGHKLKLFFFDLSFFLWYLASIFTCGLLLLYVIPYHMAARIEYIHQNIFPLYYDATSMYNNQTFDTDMEEIVTPHQTRDSSDVIFKHETKDRTLYENTRLDNDSNDDFNKSN